VQSLLQQKNCEKSSSEVIKMPPIIIDLKLYKIKSMIWGHDPVLWCRKIHERFLEPEFDRSINTKLNKWAFMLMFSAYN